MGTEDDPDFGYTLLGPATTEESAIAIATQNLAYSYLVSRGTVSADSNLETDAQPALFSIMNDMLADSTMDFTAKDNILEDVRDGQDNPPYDEIVPADTGNDAFEETELGRIVTTPAGTQTQSTILDVPFGMMRVLAANRDPGDNSGIVDDLAISLEVLDIYPMQG